MIVNKYFLNIPVFGKTNIGEIFIIRYGDSVEISFTKRADKRIKEILDKKDNAKLLFYSKSTNYKRLRKQIRMILRDYKSKNYSFIVNDDLVLAALKICSNSISYPMTGYLAVKLSNYKRSLQNKNEKEEY